MERQNFKKIKNSVKNCKVNSFNFEFISNCDDMKSFDEEFSTKLYGYKSSDDYYRSTSAIRLFDKINIPLLCVNA